MVTPANDNLRSKVPRPTQGPEQTAHLKPRLRHAYKAVAKANRKAHAANKQCYDRRAKRRSFKVGDYVYIYNQLGNQGCQKSSTFWTSPLIVTAKLI